MCWAHAKYTLLGLESDEIGADESSCTYANDALDLAIRYSEEDSDTFNPTRRYNEDGESMQLKTMSSFTLKVT